MVCDCLQGKPKKRETYGRVLIRGSSILLPESPAGVYGVRVDEGGRAIPESQSVESEKSICAQATAIAITSAVAKAVSSASEPALLVRLALGIGRLLRPGSQSRHGKRCLQGKEETSDVE